MGATSSDLRRGAVLGRSVAALLGLGLGAAVVAWALPRLEPDPVRHHVALAEYLEAIQGIIMRPLEEGAPPYVLRPGIRRAPTLVTNSLGLRGPELEEPKQRPRILVLGDSFTFGFGLLEGEPFAAVLQEELDGDWEVVNAGVNGYGIPEIAAQFERLVDRVQPDVVIVTFVMNDLDDCRIFIEEGAYCRYPTLEELPAEGRFVSSVNVQRIGQLAGYRGEEFSTFVHGNSGFANFLPLGLGPTAKSRWMTYRDHLRRIQDGAAARGARTLMFSFHHAGNGAHVGLFASCNSVGMPLYTVDAEMDLGSKDHRLAWDPHPNARANQRFAEHLLRALVAEGIVDASFGEDLDPLEPIALSAELEGTCRSNQAGYGHNNLDDEVVLAAGACENLHQVIGGLEDDGGLLGCVATVLLGAEEPTTLRVEAAAPDLEPGQTRTLEVRLGRDRVLHTLEVGAETGSFELDLPDAAQEKFPVGPTFHLVELELCDPHVLATPPAERPAQCALRVRRISLR